MMFVDNALAIRQQFSADIHRPRYHFLPPSNWMNDPNGVIQWNGQYHLFYQYNPNAAFWDDMHWAHAVSSDLVHWRDLPIAMAPTPGGPDAGGVFSGCIVNQNGRPVAIYTGVGGPKGQVQCVAFGSDDLITWEKHPANPILSDIPVEANQNVDFRDPFVWQQDGKWYMVVASAIKDVGGTVFLYQSDDLIHWQYLHPLMTGDAVQDGHTWECPNFFELDGKWVLIISPITVPPAANRVFYRVGTYVNHRFTPEVEGFIDHAYLYAPLTTLDEQGRRLMWGWLREGRAIEAHSQAGWAGMQSVPRELYLDAQNRLNWRPVPEIETLRGNHHHFANLTLSGEVNLGVRGLALDIVADIELAPHGAVTFSVAASADEHTDITYYADTAELVVNRDKSSSSAHDQRYPHRVPHVLDAGETLQLRILLDGSALEIIANHRTSVTTRVYPANAASDAVRLTGHNALVRSLDIYEMRSIWQ